ncbi:hypothetical protein WKN18_003282 [Vibrio cholerae]
MSQNALLKKQIDQLCQTLGITDPLYTSKSTEAQLLKIIDELESRLPDDEPDEESTEIQEEQPEGSSEPDLQEPSNKDGDHGSENVQNSESNGTDSVASSQDQSEAKQGKGNAPQEVLVLSADELPDGAVIDEGKSPEVIANDHGDVKIRALSAFQIMSHGKPLLLLPGTDAFVEESAALDAIDAGVAALYANL